MSGLSIEPMLIYHGSHKWTNPELESILSDLNTDEEFPDWYHGNIFRFWIDHENGKGFHTIAKIDKKIYDSFFGESEAPEARQERYKDQMIQELRVLLGEDFWSPGGEQFYFTDFGTRLNQEIPMFEGTLNFQFSPDVVVHPDNKERTEWGFSS